MSRTEYDPEYDEVPDDGDDDHGDEEGVPHRPRSQRHRHAVLIRLRYGGGFVHGGGVVHLVLIGSMAANSISTFTEINFPINFTSSQYLERANVCLRLSGESLLSYHMTDFAASEQQSI